MPSTAVSRIQLPAQPRLATRLPDFITLMKPRVMVLAVFTALVGLTIAPGDLDPLLACLAVLRSPRAPAPPVSSICGTTPISMP